METKSRYTQIKRRYGIIGKCAKNNSEILNTINNILRCYSCPYFRPVRDEKHGFDLEKKRESS